MRVKVWILTVLYFSVCLLCSILTLNKVELLDEWCWLKKYFSKKTLGVLFFGKTPK